MRRSLIQSMVLLAVVPMVFAGTGFSQQKHSQVAEAKKRYAAIFSHAEQPCKAAQTTSSQLDCIGAEVAFTETHLKGLVAAVRGIASQDEAMGTASSGQWKLSELEMINRAHEGWLVYRKNMCDLVAIGMEGGSGEEVARMECTVRMNREYAKELADAVSLTILAE